MKNKYLYIALSILSAWFVFVSCEDTVSDTDGDTGASPIYEEDSLITTDSIRFPDFLVEFSPAPGQFINVAPGLPSDAKSIIGSTGLVSLGGWGGYIAVGFNSAIVNDTSNLYGVDFTVVGNAYEGSSEPGIVMVMQDVNGNKLADDIWYELAGEQYHDNSTTHNYQITYYHTNDSVVTWKDNQGQSDTLLRNGFHDQDYYPLAVNYPGTNQDSISFSGTKIESRMVEESENVWVNPHYGIGYADNSSVNSGVDLNLPDNPATTDVAEGCGGDAFDISWAVDSDGNQVHLDSIHFVKIHNAVLDANPRLGDVSTEIRAIVPVK